MKVAFNNFIVNNLKDTSKYQSALDLIKKTSTNYVNNLTSLNFSSNEKIIDQNNSQSQNDSILNVQNNDKNSSPSSPKKSPTVKSSVLVSRNSVEANSKKIINKIKTSNTLYLKHFALQELCNYMLLYPDSISIFNKENTIKLLLSQKDKLKDESSENLTRQALATLGYAPPVKGTGVKLLSIDGGGTKGLVILEVLRHLEKITGKQIHESFDLISGVSTGAILATLLGIFRLSIDECTEIYKETSSVMFKSDLLSGTSRLLFKHAYYDTAKWEKILKDMFTEKTLIETAQAKDGPRVVIISAAINLPTLQPFAFRNYNLPDKSISYYESSYKYKIWEAVRASCAAPGFFEEFALEDLVHQDGAILINNPASVAIHEAQILWPNETIQTCISCGSGRYTPNVIRNNNGKPPQLSSIVTKLSRIIDSATDVEGVHRLLQDILPAGKYYRFNPTLTEYNTIDEVRPERLKQMKIDALMYIRKNEFKFESASRCMLQEKGYLKKSKEFLRYYAIG